MVTTVNQNAKWADSRSVPTTDQDYLDRMYYGIHCMNQQNFQKNKIEKMKSKFAGLEGKTMMDYIQNTYVRNARVQYTDYRIGYRLLMQMAGEWFRRPINASVYSVNSGALSATEDAIDTHVGLYYARNEVAEMREKGYGDPFDGMESAYDGENMGSLVSKLNKTQTRLAIMQIELNDYVRTGKARDVLFSCYIDYLLGASCWLKTTLDHQGKVVVRPIDNRRLAVIEIEGDHYGEQSPLIIEKRPMTLDQVLNTWPELLKPERKEDLEKLKSWMGSNPNGAFEPIGGNWYEHMNGQQFICTYTQQFMIDEPRAQVEKFEKGEQRVTNYSPEQYLRDKDKSRFQKKVQSGEFKLDLRERRTTYECSLIGPDILVGKGPVPNQIHNPDNPKEAYYDYCGVLFNTVMGNRTSVQELLYQFEIEYNVGRMMLNREMAKFKGTVIAYNRAFLPRGANNKPVSTEQIVLTAINDGIYDFNSSADGNYAGENIDPGNLLKGIDLGVSKSLEIVIRILYDIEDTMMRIIGFNKERIGETQASSTVTNASNNLINSQSSTAPLDYFFDRFTDRAFMRYIEKRKISHAFYQKNEGNTILGADLAAALRDDENWADDFFGVYTADSRREDFIRQNMSRRGEAAVANGEIHIQDLTKAEMAETLQEAIAIFDSSLEKLQAINQQQIREEQESKLQMNRENLQAIAAKDQADKQHEIGKTIVEGVMRSKENTDQAIADYGKVVQQGVNQVANTREKNNLEK